MQAQARHWSIHSRTVNMDSVSFEPSLGGSGCSVFMGRARVVFVVFCTRHSMWAGMRSTLFPNVMDELSMSVTEEDELVGCNCDAAVNASSCPELPSDASNLLISNDHGCLPAPDDSGECAPEDELAAADPYENDTRRIHSS
jgi:hypothetical protein